MGVSSGGRWKGCRQGGGSQLVAVIKGRSVQVLALRPTRRAVSAGRQRAQNGSIQSQEYQGTM